MRKKKHPEHPNHERWLVSYADFITLLFAFFVVMFAVSQVDTNRLGRFTVAFSHAVGIDLHHPIEQGLMPGAQAVTPPPSGAGRHTTRATSLPEELATLRDTLQELSARTRELEGLELVERRDELVLRLPENVFFESGDAGVRDEARAMLATLTDVLLPLPVDVRVEGHTDDRPISTARYRSNWELSTARATAVLAVLAEVGSMAPNRLSAAGYGEFHPIAGNDTIDGRRQNRRVDLVVTMTVDLPLDPLEEPTADLLDGPLPASGGVPALGVAPISADIFADPLAERDGSVP
jgi:chemotaxis protein MotB